MSSSATAEQTVETIVRGGFGLIEGPVWCARRRGVYFSDVQHGGGVHFLDASSGAVGLELPHRRGIGGLVLHSAGGLVCSGRNIAFKPLHGGKTTVLRERDEATGLLGYNDITCDAAGRVLAGGLAHVAVPKDATNAIPPPAGENLYLIDLDGSSRIVGSGVRLTNGLQFSPDGRTLYNADTPTDCVWRYAVSHDGRDFGPRRVFARTEHGSPDGLAVAVDGSVYVACATGGCVEVFGANGTKRKEISLPPGNPMATSVCFGGDDLHDLYIVTGSVGTGASHAGSIFRVREPVAGLPVPVCRVALTEAQSRL